MCVYIWLLSVVTYTTPEKSRVSYKEQQLLWTIVDSLSFLFLSLSLFSIIILGIGTTLPANLSITKGGTKSWLGEIKGCK